MDIKEELALLKSAILEDAESVGDLKSLEEYKFKYSGRKGEIAGYFKRMKECDPADRPVMGNLLNELKKIHADKVEEISSRIAVKSLKTKKVDHTLPGSPAFYGSRHPLLLVLDEVKQFFTEIGFEIWEGPEAETEYYNFDALNFPKDHPAKDEQDTLFLNNGNLLRTHTSPCQVRFMEKNPPPIRMIAPGRVYRDDNWDATHSPVFYQVEGLYIDKGVTFQHLKGVILAFARRIFGKDAKIRFRPSFFPFTEPSAEYDFQCVYCKGKGCRICKGTGWIEISGAGMVDPGVFKYVNIDSEKYTGYAFGMGVERIAMLRFGIDRIRLFYDNDLRFIRQFS